jgi:hypothetical protein
VLLSKHRNLLAGHHRTRPSDLTEGIQAFNFIQYSLLPLESRNPGHHQTWIENVALPVVADFDPRFTGDYLLQKTAFMHRWSPFSLSESR